ncbi:lysophospholipid acyltransferase family protein [Segnochrobactraceae bacterium EtOH-i3]
MRSPRVQRFIGNRMADYLMLVGRTSRWVYEPADYAARVEADLPVIFAMWHGQHFMVPVIKPRRWASKVMISRSRDGELNAVACARFDIGLIRASGGTTGAQVRKRGGVRGFLEALHALRDGYSLALTADVPKVSRVAGSGIVMIARASGRPILPVAVATSRRLDMKNSWDKSAVNLPFSYGATVVGEPIYVPADADADALEAARLAVQAALDTATARAYAIVDGREALPVQPAAGLG